MALDPWNSSSLEQLALKGLMVTVTEMTISGNKVSLTVTVTEIFLLAVTITVAE